MKTSNKVLFIDDEKHIRQANTQTLELADMEVVCYETAEAALPAIDAHWPGVVVCDIRLPKMDGLSFMAAVREIDSDLPVILITGHGDISTAVQAMRDGAYDFIEKPYSSERLVKTVQRALEKRALTLENRTLRRELEAQEVLGPRIIGRTVQMDALRTTIAQIADTGADVLITGETGTGKELVARSLHEQSRRRSRNFVAVNCGAVSDSLIESELFGHEAGAFTDAREQRIGKFEYANGGTLLLDEIESMPLRVQVHLLRTLQERTVERLGSNKSILLDLRVVAAAKSDLKELTGIGTFREDLYYRLSVVQLRLAPLRERREDIPLLFRHFVLVASHRYQQEAPLPDNNQMNALMAYSWPGNVRELRNVAERYVLLGAQNDWRIDRLMSGSVHSEARSLAEQVERFERSLIEQALAAGNGSIKKAMDTLSIPRKTLSDKMRKYRLDKSDFKE
ncbi:sigma-54-dependent transcriptional regulator [Desulfofustis glycolicus]|uniref:Two-component system, NtrC family, C4-dicarboxylate transport response regulator DctD n=1 Tax=Desulfofustis glycolicus DSM 9705 TaxID=1121409 RepID=A0A1M5UB71_9BACT|nr:sigma-54 dependent transcriptional regulator [Desulfofustis glycolicus]MCB2214546.1 sigma-54 dependent transcriptional regulator [Desulfobulbaceae bacterium]SHH60190.1 two-component system, NtrC family, C4-dicarboxylate transport response regulator DctD [Desulfofustis glycolicus DSM 9705]